MAAFRLTSPAFDHDDDLPERFTSDGGSVSPPLAWEGVPEAAKELVIISEDVDSDSGVVTHWVVYGLSPESTGLPEGIGTATLVADPECCQGLNEYDESGWTGPIADDDRGPHRIFFRIFALDIALDDLPPGITRLDLRAAAGDHVIAKAELVAMT